MSKMSSGCHPSPNDARPKPNTTVITMYEYTRMSHKYQNLDQEDITEEWYKQLREEFTMSRTTFDAPNHIEVELTYQDRCSEKTLTGVLLTMSVNNPHLRFESGKHGFISTAEEGEDARLLFNKPWDGGFVPRYKYEITEMEVKAYWFETPVCPTCDVDMEFGMPRGDRHEFPVASWLCPECFPTTYEKGIK